MKFSNTFMNYSFIFLREDLRFAFLAYNLVLET